VLRAERGADAYIPPMEQNALTEEKYRLDIAFAAIDVAGSHDRNFPLAEVLPEERRVYLYAVPDAQAGEGGARVSDLTQALRKADVPHAVAYDRKSERAGLRYLPDFIRVPPELRKFTGPEARQGWESWKEAEKEVSRVVAGIATEIAADPNYDLGANRLPGRVEGPADMADDKHKSGARRRTPTGERS
jgi:hypothetical protein